MRLGVLALAAASLLIPACGKKNKDPLKPQQPAVQIVIPDTPGWSPSKNDTNIYARFDVQLHERIRASEGVIKNMTWHQKDLATVVTLFGDHPDQILFITLPFFKHAGLPAGTKVTKYDGADGNREEPVQIGS